MEGLDLRINRSNHISITNIGNDIDIAESKWNFVFDFILNKTNTIYYKASELNYYDQNFTEDLNNLSDEILMDLGTKHARILFRVKPISVHYNRRLLSKMWNYYYTPSLIFLPDQSQEDQLVELVRSRAFISEIVETLESVYVLYKEFENDVLWLECSPEVEDSLNTLIR